MDEQLLKDLLATAQAHNYNWSVIMPKFPELKDVELQVLKDYTATAEAYNYDYSVINPKFPELFTEPVKKKEGTESVSADGSSDLVTLEKEVDKQIEKAPTTGQGKWRKNLISAQLKSTEPQEDYRTQTPQQVRTEGLSGGIKEYERMQAEGKKLQAQGKDEEVQKVFSPPAEEGKPSEYALPDGDKLLEEAITERKEEKEKHPYQKPFAAKGTTEFKMKDIAQKRKWEEKLIGDKVQRGPKYVEWVDKGEYYEPIIKATGHHVNKDGSLTPYKETEGEGLHALPDFLEETFVGAEGLPFDALPEYEGMDSNGVFQEGVDSSKWTAEDWKKWRDKKAQEGLISKKGQDFGETNIWRGHEEEKKQIYDESLDGFGETVNSIIHKALISKEEEYVVPRLNEVFGEYNFEFEEVQNEGPLGLDLADTMKAYRIDPRTGARKEEIEINLDVALLDKENTKEVNRLSGFLNRHRPAKGSPKEEFYRKRYVSKEELDTDLKHFNKMTKSFELTTETLKGEIEALDIQMAKYKSLETQKGKDDPEVKALKKQVREEWYRVNSATKRWEWLKNEYAGMGGALDRAASEKFRLDNLPEGTILGAAWNELIGGVSDIYTGGVGLALDLGTQVASEIADPSTFFESKEEEEKALQEFFERDPVAYSDIEKRRGRAGLLRHLGSDKYIKEIKYGKDKAPSFTNIFSQAATEVTGEDKKGIIGTMRDNALLDFVKSSTTTSYTQDLMEENVIAQGTLGMIRSSPAIAVSMLAGPEAGQALFFLQTFEQIDREMSENPAFKNITEREKLAYKVPMSMVVMGLEQAGVRNVLANSPAALNVLSSVLGQSTKKTTAKEFSQLIRQEVKNKLAQGTIFTLTGAAAEAETEGAQAVADIMGKKAFNKIKEGEYFDTPKTLAEGTEIVMESALAGAIGGGIMKQPQLIANARRTKNNFSGMSNAEWQLFQYTRNNSEYLDLMKEGLQVQVLNKKISAEDARRDLEIYQQVSQTSNQIPTHLPIAEQKESLGLLLKKKDLQEEIKDKDPALSKSIQKQIDVIDNRLEEIGEQDADAQQVKGGQYVTYNAPEGSVYDAEKKTVKGGENKTVQPASITRNQMIEKINNLKTQEDIVMSGIYIKEDPELVALLKEKIEQIQDPDKPSYPTLKGTETEGASGLGMVFRERFLKQPKTKEDAIQKQSTIDVDADKQTADVQEMVEGKPTTGPEGTAKEAIKDDGKEVVSISETDSNNPDFIKGSMKTFEVDGGILEIGKVKGAGVGSILRLNVDEKSRRKGKAEKLLKKALDETKGELSGSATSDASVSLNYKLGMRIKGGETLSLEETIEKRKEKGEDGSVLMVLPQNQRGENYKSHVTAEAAVKEEVKDDGKEVTQEVFKEFTDTGKVSEEVVDSISKKVKEGKPLTKEEEAIRQDKSTEIEEKLKVTVVQEGTDISKVEEVKKIKEKVKPPVKKVLQETQRVHKKIKDVLPDFEIVVHETEEGYNKQMKGVNGPESSEGLFSYTKTPDGKYKGRIDINLSKASGRTVAHEIAHGVMLREFGANPRTFKNVQKKIIEVLNDEQQVELNDFIKQYEETEQPEEFLAEMSAMLAEKGDKLSQQGLNKIAAIISEFISKHTGGKIKIFKDAASTKEIIDFFNSVSDAINKGEQVVTKETVAVKETPKKTVVEKVIAKKAPVKEAPVKEAPVAPTQTKKDKLFFSFIGDDKKFDMEFGDGDKSTERSIYIVELDSPNATTGTLTLDKNNHKALRKAINGYHETQIRPAIIEDNLRPDDSMNFSVEIVKPGKVRKVGNSWKIVEEMHISYTDGGRKITDATKPTIRARKSAQEGPEPTPQDFRDAEAAAKESLQEQIEIEELKDIAQEAVLQRRNKTQQLNALAQEIKDRQEEKKILKESPEFIIADNLPKITPESARRYGTVGTKGDISPSLTSKKGVSTERAAEKLSHGGLEEDLGYESNMDHRDVENIIIEILLKGKKKFKSDILEDVNNEIQELQEQKAALQKQKPVSKAKQIESVNNFVMDARNKGYADKPIRVALNSYGISEAIINDAVNIPTTAIQEESRITRQELQNRIKEISKDKKVKLSAATVKNIAGKINKAKLSLKDGSINEKEVDSIINYIEVQYDKASDRAVQIQEKNKQLRKDRREKAKKIKQEKKEAKSLESRRKLAAKRVDAVLNRPNDVISTDLKRLFARNSKTIPASVREEYAALVKVFAVPETKRKVPKISEIQENLNAVNDAIDMRDGNLDILKNAYESFDNKVLDENGKINYAATLERMVAKGDITEADAKLMKKPENKKVIDTTTQKTQEEKEESKKEKEQREKEEKASLIKDIKGSEIDANQVLKTQSDKSIKERMRKNLDALQRLIKSDLNSLDNKQLKTLQSAIVSINNGTFNHAAYKILVDLETNSKGKSITPALKRFSKYTGGWENNVTKALSKLKAKVVGKSATEVELNTTALEFMELVFGKKDGAILYENVFESSAESQEKYVLDKRSVNDALVKIQEKLYKGMTHDEMLDSSYSISAYLINQEAVTNEGNKEVNAEGAKAFLDETIVKKNNEQGEIARNEEAALRKVRRKQPTKLTKESVKEQYNKFSAKEKLAIQAIQKINQDLAPKAAYTAAVIRGKNFSPRPDYIHISTLKDADTEIKDIQELRERYTKPSTKSGTTEERTGKASPINFDVFTSVSSGATQTLLDYHLTTPLKIGADTLRKAEENLEKNEEGNVKDKKQREAIKALQDGYKAAAEEVIGLNDLGLTTGPATKALRFAKRQSYRSMLAGVFKGTGEGLSNVYYAARLDRKALQKGYEIAGVRSTLMGEELLDLMTAVDATTITRLFPKGLAGRLIDRSTAMDSDGVKRLDYTRFKRGINKLTDSQYAAFVASAADAMLSTPDKLVMRVFWTGSFVNELSELTGEKIGKEQLQKISQDAEYKAKYKEEIKKAKRFADKNAVLVGNSTNPFTGALAARGRGKNEGAMDEAIRTYNNFLVSFMRMEWTAFRKGMQEAFDKDSTPKEKSRGHALMQAAAGRVLLYPMAIALLTSAGAYMVGGDDDDERGIGEKAIQNLSSMFVSLFLGRGSGQISRAVINFGSEYLNKGIREEMGMDYDAYKNSIAYSPVPVDAGNKRDFQVVKALAGGLGGPISPQLKWILLGISILTRPEVTSGTKKHTKERYTAENWRLLLEPFGLLGMMPFYKDLRFLFMKRMYRNVGKKSSGGGSSSSSSKKTKTESKFDKKKKFGGDSKFGSDKNFSKRKF